MHLTLGFFLLSPKSGDIPKTPMRIPCPTAASPPSLLPRGPSGARSFVFLSARRTKYGKSKQ